MVVGKGLNINCNTYSKKIRSMEICKMWELGTRVNLKLSFILFCTFEVVLNQSFKNVFLSLFPLLFVFISLSLFLITFMTVFACLPEASARAEKTQEIENCPLFGFKRLQLRLTTSTHERYFWFNHLFLLLIYFIF